MIDPREIPLSLNRPELKLLYQHLGALGGPGASPGSNSDSGAGAGSSSPGDPQARLGEILRDFYHRMSQDVLIGYFFDGKDVDAIAAMQKQFLLRAMGAIPSYSGKPPAQAHENLPNILRGHFDRRLQILEATLRDYGLSAEDIRTWLTFENAFRDGIVKEEGPRETNPRPRKPGS